MKMKPTSVKNLCNLSLFFAWLCLVTACQAATGSSRPQPQPGPDADRDWVSDLDEEKFGTDPSQIDSDGDGLSDFEEIFVLQTDPTVAREPLSEEDLEEDRDFDGLPDLFEVQNGSDPGKIDTDNDLVSDYLEFHLTESDPAEANPLNENGFPTILEPWLPQHLQNVSCRVSFEGLIDKLIIVDVEEEDDDILPGDELFVYHGVWIDPPESDLDVDFPGNAPYTGQWNWTVLAGEEYEEFFRPDPRTVECGRDVGLLIQAYESDEPFGGVRNMGVYRDVRPILFDRIPLAWNFRPASMYFEGTGGDSQYYRYDFEYSFSVIWLP